MKNHSNRLQALEQIANPLQQVHCYIPPTHTEADGYTVTEHGGRNPQHFDSRAALDVFAARPDIDLIIIQVVYQDKQPMTTIQQGDYTARVGIDWEKI